MDDDECILEYGCLVWGHPEYHYHFTSSSAQANREYDPVLAAARMEVEKDCPEPEV